MSDIATVLTTMFAYVDDWCKAHPTRAHGPLPDVSDSEIMTVALWCELCGISSEHAQIRYWQRHLLSFFPSVLERSRYHRRRVVVLSTLNALRQSLLTTTVLGVQDLRIIDSTPVPVITFRRAGFTPLFPEAAYGYCAAKREYYYGFKFHLVTDKTGIPLHFDLTPANIPDIQMAEELLAVASPAAVTIADKGYVSAPVATTLYTRYQSTLLAAQRANQTTRESPEDRRLLNGWRQRIEVVNAMLKERFHLGKTFAKTLGGLVTRIIVKMTSFTMGVYVNRLLGNPPLAFASIAC